ncbi:hypothetical protein [Billgrantia montanilacus]|uniref:Uncharacterized protein n=1 Tax=Billgrantia montanilacus TaxID=2282305 RepID=A0A368TXU8_9GAMM|nr:hypothetical protein [Halomonas montanilacus]RCV89659.1 hypothetical protein DU505_08615 [Halomonas montanilacus]
MLKKIALATAVVSMFSVPAFASFGSATENGNFLQEGSTTSKIINSGQAHTYYLDVEQATAVKIGSDHFPGTNHPLQRMSAQLVDAQGNIVTEAKSSAGNFEIQETLQPGQYRLMVSGSSAPGGDSWDVHRYSLHVNFQ